MCEARKITVNKEEQRFDQSLFKFAEREITS